MLSVLVVLKVALSMVLRIYSISQKRSTVWLFRIFGMTVKSRLNVDSLFRHGLIWNLLTRMVSRSSWISMVTVLKRKL
nr:MAG TPA: hypothetical protein [Caudoviricetes sp.]